MYPTVVAVRMAEWPRGLGHGSCPQLYFLLHVSCGHFTKPFIGLKFLCLLMGMINCFEISGRQEM